MVTDTTLFLMCVLLRGIGFGTALAAVLPTAQAYIADVTTDEAARVRGMAGIGAAQGIAMVAGSVLIAFRLRREPRHQLVERPARVSPADPRVWPFLLAGFGMFTALGFIQVITGFIVQDRLDLDAATTGPVAGGAVLAAGVGLIAAQTIVVPRSGWPPVVLLRAGGVIALIGFGLLIPDLGPARCSSRSC